MTTTPSYPVEIKHSAGEAILRLPQVKGRCGLARSSIYARVKEGSFPAPVNLGERAVGWLESEIDAWIEARKVSRHQELA